MVTPLPQTAARSLSNTAPTLRRETEASAADVPETLSARPLTALFDDAFDLYRRHFVKIASLVAVGFVPIQIALHALVNLVLRPWSARIDNITDTGEQIGQALMIAFSYLGAGYPQYGIPGIFSLLALLVLSGVVAVGVASALHGEPIHARVAYARLRRTVFRLAGVWLAAMTASVLIIVVMVFLLMIMLGILAIAVGGVMPDVVGYGFTVGMIVCPYAAVAAFLARTFLLATPLIVLEGRTVGEVPTRNGQLLRKTKFWKVWLAAMGLPIVVFGLQYFVFFGAKLTLNNFGLPPALFSVIESLLATLIYFFFQPYWMIFLTLLYFDGRVRRDAYDLYRMADDLEKTDVREAVS